MPRYSVTIKRTVLSTVLVEASSPAEAKRQVADLEWADLNHMIESDGYRATSVTEANRNQRTAAAPLPLF